jgi:hypothetical protein
MEIGEMQSAACGCARSAALACMTKALIHLDGDMSIPPLVAAQLQLAIDRLWNSENDAPALIDIP